MELPDWNLIDPRLGVMSWNSPDDMFEKKSEVLELSKVARFFPHLIDVARKKI